MNTNPDRIQLLELSLDSFRNYVGKVCELLRTTYKSGEMQQTLQVAENTSVNIRNVFHGTSLPTTLANEITFALLEEIMCKFSCYNFETWPSEIFVQLVDSIMHPQATRIILEPDPVHSQYYSNFRMGIIPLVVPNLIVRSNIIALRFGHMRSNTDFSWQYYPKQLQELTIYGYLNDERLETVVESCQQLKLLNISDSQNITDTSINIILKLKLLQALYVSGTHLTEDGIDRLLLGLSENEANRSSEKSFKCFGGLNDTNIGTLTETLPNVVQISLYSSSDHSLLLNLTKLNNLKSLSIGPIIPGAEVLTCLGKQLTCLHLENFETLDLITIGENCDSLKCFHISGDCAFESEEELSEEEFSSIRLPGFLSIECLCLDIPKDHDGTILLLARCPNVKKLYLSLYEILFETVIEAVSEHNKLEYLETLYVTPFGDITEKEANVLATTFKNIRVFHGGFPEVTRACGVKFFKF